MIKLVLIRHGESTDNAKNQFSGWRNVELTDKGIEQAKKAGRILKKNGYVFDLAFTSYLKRAQHTLHLVLDEMNLDIEAKDAWQLNERHYGALQGLNKSQTAKEKGEKQVFLWRRSFDVKPPALEDNDPTIPELDPLYQNIPKHELPRTECLSNVVDRVLPYWDKDIVPRLKSGKRVIISAHGNSLRALIKYLDNMTGDEIAHLNIPVGVPLVYELDDDLKPIKHYYLGDPEEIQKIIEGIRNQGKA